MIEAPSSCALHWSRLTPRSVRSRGYEDGFAPDCATNFNGNTGATPDVICRLTYGPSIDRDANNSGRANFAGGGYPPPRRWLHL